MWILLLTDWSKGGHLRITTFSQREKTNNDHHLYQESVVHSGSVKNKVKGL